MGPFLCCEPVDEAKKKRLEDAGWRVGSVEDFLDSGGVQKEAAMNQDDPIADVPHMTETGWDEFYESGMLWMVNRTLHIFGWSIVLQYEDDGSVSRAWPSRTKWKGFGQETNEAGYARVESWLQRLFGSRKND